MSTAQALGRTYVCSGAAAAPQTLGSEAGQELPAWTLVWQLRKQTSQHKAVRHAKLIAAILATVCLPPAMHMSETPKC